MHKYYFHKYSSTIAKALLCLTPLIVWYYLFIHGVIYELKARADVVSQLNLLPIVLLITLLCFFLLSKAWFKNHRSMKYSTIFILILLIPLLFDEKRHEDIVPLESASEVLININNFSKSIVENFEGDEFWAYNFENDCKSRF
jgi:hypothetical protein